jgi:Tfp pilus assembly protein PilF
VQKDWAQAEVLFQRLLQQTEPRVQSQGYGGLAAVAFARGAVQQAASLVAQAEALDPESAAGQVIRGHILWHEGKLGAAKVAYRMATDNMNALPWQQATAANRLGRIYAAEGLAGNALQYYDRALSQCPQMAPIYVNKAHLLEQLGRRPEALMLYRQAVQIDPDDPLAVTLLRQAERQEQLAQDRQQQAHLAQRVAALLHAHQAGRFSEPTGDGWTSAPLTLTVLAVQRPGSLAPQAGEEAFLASSLAQALRDSGRIVVLEHALLERLLVELKRSMADLTDPQIALHVGRILAARLLATGIILATQAEETLSLSLIETATGALRARAAMPWTPDARLHIVEQVARVLLSQVHQTYPVQGRITSVSPQGIALNIGADQGVTSGMTMQVFGNAEPDAPGRRVGLIEVTTVEAQHAQAIVLEYAEALQQGWRVQEMQQP